MTEMPRKHKARRSGPSDLTDRNDYSKHVRLQRAHAKGPLTRQERTSALRDLQEADLAIDPQNPAHQPPTHFSDPYPGFHPSEPLLFSSSTGSRRLYDPDEPTAADRATRDALDALTLEDLERLADSPVELPMVADSWERHRLLDKLKKVAAEVRRRKSELYMERFVTRAIEIATEPKQVSIARAIMVDSTRSDRDLAREHGVRRSTVSAIRRDVGSTQTA